MIHLDKTHTKINKTNLYNLIVLVIYFVFLIIYKYFKIVNKNNYASEMAINALYMSLWFSIIGLLFIPKNIFVWINVIMPLIANLPYFLSLIAVTHGDFFEVIRYYFNSILTSPLEMIKLIF